MASKARERLAAQQAGGRPARGGEGGPVEWVPLCPRALEAAVALQLRGWVRDAAPDAGQLPAAVELLLARGREGGAGRLPVTASTRACSSWQQWRLVQLLSSAHGW